MHFSARISTASTCSLVHLPGWYADYFLGILSASRSQIRFSSVMVRILRRMDSSIIGLRLSQGSSVFFGLAFYSGRSIPVLISLGRFPVSAVVLYMLAITLCTFINTNSLSISHATACFHYCGKRRLHLSWRVAFDLFIFIWCKKFLKVLGDEFCLLFLTDH